MVFDVISYALAKKNVIIRKKPIFEINKPSRSLNTWYKVERDTIVVMIGWGDSYYQRVDVYIDLSSDGGTTIYYTCHTGVAKIAYATGDYTYVLAWAYVPRGWYYRLRGSGRNFGYSVVEYNLMWV